MTNPTTIHTTAARATSFTRKQIAVTFNIALPDGGTDSLTLSETHRIRATVSDAGIGIGAHLILTIEGMMLEFMNRLSFVSSYPNAQNAQTTDQSNTIVIVRAGIYGTALKSVFIGNIREAWTDFSGGSAIFHVKAQNITKLTQIIPEPLSYNGARDVPSLISDICVGQGIILRDHGGWDGVILQNHYKGGTLLDQIDDVIKSAGGVYHFDVANGAQNSTQESNGFIGTLSIWGPKGKKKKEKNIPLISAETGLIDYPKYTASGISLSCLFRQDISFYEPIEVRSAYIPHGWQLNSQGMNEAGQQIGSTNAPWNGVWLPYFIQHDLSSESAGAPWLTQIECQLTDVNLPNAVKTK